MPKPPGSESTPTPTPPVISRPVLRMQVTPRNPWYRLRAGDVCVDPHTPGMTLNCYGVHFNSYVRERLEAQYENDEALLCGSPIVSPVPSELPTEFWKYSGARVNISYPEAYSMSPPVINWIVKFHLVGSDYAKAAIYSRTYLESNIPGNLAMSRLADGERELEVYFEPPPRGTTLRVYLLLECAHSRPNFSRETRLVLKKVEFLTTWL